MSKIILFGNQKGGVGKTTLTALCAGALASDPFRRRVFVADLDNQQSLARRRLLDIQAFNEIPPYKIEAPTLAEFLSEVQDLDNRFDLIFIDAAGKLDTNLSADQQEITKLLLLADVLCIPVEPGNYALEATLDYIAIARRIKAKRQADRPLEIIVTINKAEPHTIDDRQLAEEIEEIKLRAPDITFIDTPLRRYTLFRAVSTLESLYSDQGGDKARANFRQWLGELISVIDKK